MSSCVSIDKVTFGDCPRCGGSPPGGRPPLSGADARRDTNKEQRLFLFEGEYLCDQCIQDIKNDDQSEIDSERIRDEQRFLAKAGFVNQIT